MNKTPLSAKLKQAGTMLLKALKHVVLHNGWVKLIALLISLVIWSGLISQDETLTRDKTWQNVNVSITGTDTLKRNGYIVVSDLTSLLSGVTVTAAVPQKQYDAAEISSYNIRVDLSKINSTGTQELKILATSSNLYGKVVNTVPSTVTVDVEEYFVRSPVPVSLTVTGEYQNGWYKDWYMAQPRVDPELISVNGPRSIVQTISRARVFLDPESLEWTEDTIFTTGEIKLYNRAGEEISSPLLGITTESLSIDTVLIEANVLPTKSFRVEDSLDLLSRCPEGYMVTGVKVSPETVTVAARSEVLQQLNELPLDSAMIPKDVVETPVFQIKVQKPSEDAVLSNDTITVSVEIGQLDE
jgi:YbbR domain-containing protein